MRRNISENLRLKLDALPKDTFLKQHEILVANCFAQSKALAIGSSRKSGEKRSDGNRPSTTILGTRLDPYTLGQLVALYEHKVFTMGAIWQINSFDQEGVQMLFPEYCQVNVCFSWE